MTAGIWVFFYTRKEGRLKLPRAIPRNAQRQRAHARRESSRPVAVAHVPALGRPLEGRGPDEVLELAGERLLNHGVQQVAEDIGGRLRNRDTRGILVATGHRASPGHRGASTPLVNDDFTQKMNGGQLFSKSVRSSDHRTDSTQLYAHDPTFTRLTDHKYQKSSGSCSIRIN